MSDQEVHCQQFHVFNGFWYLSRIDTVLEIANYRKLFSLFLSDNVLSRKTDSFQDWILSTLLVVISNKLCQNNFLVR